LKQAKTLRKQKFKKSAFTRTASSYAGGAKILMLLARAEPSLVTGNDVSNVVANQDALTLLQHLKGNF